MTMNSSDAALVAGHLAGDPSALAGIYDRYSNPLHDTAAAMLNDRSEAADVLHDVILIAAERLDQLRDPDRLKPWLFAILRNEVYGRTKKRRRTIATDFSGSDDGWDMADDREVDPATDVSDDAAVEDMAELVRNAARGLDDRDQLVLELSVRQGLGGQDLADALGVSANQSYTLVHRMRERVERSLTAYVVAKAGRNDCGDLDKMLAKWDGEFTVLVRKRVARHVDACDVCDTRRSKVAPLAMFGSAPVYAAPAALRDRVLSGAAARAAAPQTPYQFNATDGFPQVVRTARRVAAWVAPTAAASLILVVAGLSLTFIDRGNDDVVRDEALVVSANDLATTTTTSPEPTTVAPSTSSGASNDAVPGISTTTPLTIPGDSIPAKEQPATTPPATAAPPASARPTQTRPPNTAGPTQTAPPTPATTAATTTTPATSPPGPGTTAVPSPTPTTTTTTTTTTTAAPTPGQLSVAGGSISLGSGSSSGSVTLTNLGDLPVTFTAAGPGVSGAFSISPQSGTLSGGTSTSVTASLDRSNLAEGSSPSGTLMIAGGDGSSFSVSLSAQVERAPIISNGQPNPSCNSTDVTFFSGASISDESRVASGSWSLSGPNGQSGTVGLNGNNGFNGQSFPFGPSIDPAFVNGTWSWSISATDTRGNVGSASGSVTVAC